MICKSQRGRFCNLLSNQFASHPKLRTRRALSDWVEQLERRDVPAVIQWSGAAGTDLWTDAANWSGSTIPGQNDQVVIPVNLDADAAAHPILIQTPVVIENITTDRPVFMSGSNASLRLTNGDSTFSAGLNIQYAGLAVQGATTRLTIDGATQDPSQGLVMALDGAEIQWNGIQTLNNMVLFINSGSSIEMPELKTIENISELTNMSGRFVAPELQTMTLSRLSLFNSGTYILPSLADASMTLVEVNGADAHLELPGLTKFDAGRFRIDQGASVTAENLKVVNVGPATAWAFSWYVGQNSQLVLPNLIYINALAQPSPNEAPDARIQLRGNGQILINPSRWTMTNGLVTFSFSGDSKLDGSLVLGSKTILTGSGTITGSVDNFGLLSPSGDYSPYGTFSVKGDWTNRPGAVVDLQLGGPAKLDRLMIGGQATFLGGDLKIQFSDEFASDPVLLPIGQYQLMTWSTWAGQFATSPTLVPRSDGIQITAQTQYQPNGLVEKLSRFNTNPDIISVSDMVFPEGNDPISYGLFTIHRTGPMTVPLTISYQVIEGSAKSGTNFTFPGGPITMAPGETERQIRFIIRGNTAYSGDKTFQVKLTSVSERGELGQSLASVTIKEDDPAPQIISPAVVPPKSNLSAAAKKLVLIRPVPKSKPKAKPLPPRPVSKVKSLQVIQKAIARPQIKIARRVAPLKK